MTDPEIARVAELMKQPNAIFVFGSNLAGRHGKGAALVAKNKYGAVPGVGMGIQGRSWAIPTKDGHLNVLPPAVIRVYVDRMLTVAQSSPALVFVVTKVGCGLAGYSEEEIKPFFKNAPANCELPIGWR
jgi:hypothetical protein